MLSVHAPRFLHTYFKRKALDELYFSLAIKSLAESLVTIFVPIYLFVVTHELPLVGLYFLIYAICDLLFMAVSLLLVTRIGLKLTLLVGILVAVFYYYMLEFVIKSNSYFVFAAVLLALSTALQSSAILIAYVKVFVSSEEGQDVSMVTLLSKLASVLGPLLGAIFISSISFQFLFLFVGVIQLASILPLITMPSYPLPKENLTLKGSFRADSKKKALAYASNGAVFFASEIFWPIFIFIGVGGITSVGWIASISTFMVVLALFFIGKLADSQNSRLLSLGVFIQAPLWLLRILVINPISFVFVNFLHNISLLGADVSLSKVAYHEAKAAPSIISYLLFREGGLFVGRLFLLAVVFLTNSFSWIFFAAFVATFGMLAVRKNISK